MPDDHIVEYHAHRKHAELAMAQATADPAVRNIHREMAARHDELAGGADEEALNVVAVAGNVEVSTTTGSVASLTPDAAFLTSDRLLVRAREAERQAADASTPADE